MTTFSPWISNSGQQKQHKSWIRVTFWQWRNPARALVTSRAYHAQVCGGGWASSSRQPSQSQSGLDREAGFTSTSSGSFMGTKASPKRKGWSHWGLVVPWCSGTKLLGGKLMLPWSGRRPGNSTYQQCRAPEWHPNGWESHWPEDTPDPGQRVELDTRPPARRPSEKQHAQGGIYSEIFSTA